MAAHKTTKVAGGNNAVGTIMLKPEDKKTILNAMLPSEKLAVNKSIVARNIPEDFQNFMMNHNISGKSPAGMVKIDTTSQALFALKLVDGDIFIIAADRGAFIALEYNDKKNPVIVAFRSDVRIPDTHGGFSKPKGEKISVEHAEGVKFEEGLKIGMVMLRSWTEDWVTIDLKKEGQFMSSGSLTIRADKMSLKGIALIKVIVKLLPPNSSSLQDTLLPT